MLSNGKIPEEILQEYQTKLKLNLIKGTPAICRGVFV